ncbi:MAG: hypothetical protein HND42_11660 [Armatimonadetes bacterium]|nr:MAG: hypothetical protein EDM73_09495 [Armatimonadota bacterium]MCE7899666.1 hypothetical protein [Armatimonadetes bacterium ATM1]MDL1927751.1 hypothetical protein [Fimbriimonadia bacterium ATM]MBC6970471.1 hypothetical protein [Armatimonadota bacterium]MBL1150852.1 hypothetical protein [Armatimonadota bacterium]
MPGQDADDFKPKRRARKPHPERVLKVCPLCATVNVSSASECFRCGWDGDFDTDAGRVQTRVHRIFTPDPRFREALKNGAKAVVSWILKAL